MQDPSLKRNSLMEKLQLTHNDKPEKLKSVSVMELSPLEEGQDRNSAMELLGASLKSLLRTIITKALCAHIDMNA